MLTENEVQYVAAILAAVERPDAVEIVAGKRVEDVEAKEKRDVDVTILQHLPDGRLRAYTGYEVKAHHRPLDVTHVEQLCAKLLAMPSITERFIISTSGYTKPARRKARSKQVQLLKLVEYSGDLDFGGIKIPCDFPLTTRELEWSAPPGMQLVTDEDWLESSLSVDMAVEAEDDSPHTTFASVGIAAQKFPSAAIQSLLDRPEVAALEPGHACTVSITFVDVSAWLRLPTHRQRIREVRLTGEVRWRYTKSQPIKRLALTRDEDGAPFVGCILLETPFGSLTALVANKEKAFAIVPISEAMRKKNKIYEHRIAFLRAQL